MLSPYETMVSERSGLFSFLLDLSYYPGCLDSALGLVIAGFPATGCSDGFRKATPNSAFAWPSLRTPGLGCRAPRGTVQWVPEHASRRLASQLSGPSAASRGHPPARAPGARSPRCTAEPRSRWPRPPAIPRGAAIAGAGLAKAALRAAAMSASACDPILTKQESVGRRRGAGTAEGAGCAAEMAVSEPGGSAAVSATAGRGGRAVRGGLVGGP